MRAELIWFGVVVLFGPFVCGQLFGLHGWRVGKVCLITLAVVTMGVASYVDSELLLSDRLRLLVTTGLSFVSGFIIARKSGPYIAVVGYSGYVFTLSSATLGIGIGQLGHGVAAYLFWLASGVDKSFEFAVVLYSHVPAVLVALMLLMPHIDLGRQVLRSIVKLATLWGVLGLLVDYLQGTIEANLLWWLCGRQRMGVEGVFLSYAIGIVQALPLFKYGRADKSDADHIEAPRMDGRLGRTAGEQVAKERKYGRLITDEQETGFRIKEGLEFCVPLPDGWRCEGRTQDETHVSVRFSPPENWPAIVYLNAYAFAPNAVKKELKKEFTDLEEGQLDHPIFDPGRRSELLEHTAETNLAVRDAVINEANSDMLEGIPSFECCFKRPLRMFEFSFKRPLLTRLIAPLLRVVRVYGYVATFIVEDYEFVFMFEADSEVFQRFLPDVKLMVRNMTFKGHKLGASNGSPDIQHT